MNIENQIKALENLIAEYDSSLAEIEKEKRSAMNDYGAQEGVTFYSLRRDGYLEVVILDHDAKTEDRVKMPMEYVNSLQPHEVNALTSNFNELDFDVQVRIGSLSKMFEAIKAIEKLKLGIPFVINSDSDIIVFALKGDIKKKVKSSLDLYRRGSLFFIKKKGIALRVVHDYKNRKEENHIDHNENSFVDKNNTVVEEKKDSFFIPMVFLGMVVGVIISYLFLGR